MKKFVLSVLACACALVLSFGILAVSLMAVLPISLDVENSSVRPVAGVVVDLYDELDAVVVSDCNGILWEFLGIEDWQIGDGCCLLIDDKGTDSLVDDEIIEIRYYNLNNLSNLLD